ncbi:MAG: Two component regulator three Y domain-containing protein [Maribacter sp.]
MYFNKLFILILFPFLVLGQNLLPPVYNYKISDYQAASKNWGIAVNDEGELFVANNKGLLYFTGEQWTLNPLPNNTIIRSVLCVENRIYTGSYEEFGYWVKNLRGDLEYTSLTELIKGHQFTSEEFWEILVQGENVYFRSFTTIYKYAGNSITVVDPTVIISDMVVLQDRIIVAALNDGLFELIGETLIPLKQQQLLMGKTVTDMAVLPQGLLIGTKLGGCYLLKNEVLQPWDTSINLELKTHQLNKMIAVSDGKIAFGTIKNGIYIYDTEAKKAEVLNKGSGLQNNTVLAMLYHKEQLWVGLDNGVDRIKLDNPITYYTDYSGLLGTVYDVALYKGVMYLGTNTGVYYFDAENQLKFVDGTQGHVWDLEVVNGSLLCGHNTGTFSITDLDKLEQISDIAGGFKIIKVPDSADTYIQGTYNGLVKYAKKGDGLWDISTISGITVPIKQLCFENSNTLWAAHPYKGFYRLTINDGLTEIVKVETFEDSDLPNNYNVKLFNIKNQIVFYNRGVWFRYDPIQNKIVEFLEFDAYKNRELIYADNEHFWFVEDNNNGNRNEITYTDFKSDSLVISDVQLKERLVPESQSIIKLNDSIFCITLGDGFGSINLNELQRHLSAHSLPAPKLNAFRGKGEKYPIDGSLIDIPFNRSRQLTIEVSAPTLIKPRYFYEITGNEQYSATINDGQIAFQNLSYGDYEIGIATIGMDNAMSSKTWVKFQIAPPWYVSKVSIVLYAALLIAIVFMIRWYNKRKLLRKQKELEVKLQKEQEKYLVGLEREKLSKEIRSKQKELARTTFNIAKKNEVMLELKNMLVMDKDNFSNPQRYRNFIKKLDKSVNDKEDWKRFEVNFKELHEDFFEKLLKTYPKLTTKDLKLCAFLKMNLSSKEIAPLMGITVRGVEINRYRLRKKLHIDSSENLSNFLITF